MQRTSMTLNEIQKISRDCGRVMHHNGLTSRDVVSFYNKHQFGWHLYTADKHHVYVVFTPSQPSKYSGLNFYQKVKKTLW